MTLAQLIPLAINISLFAIVFSLGLRSTIPDMAYVLRRPGLLARSLLSMNVIMLILAAAAAMLLPLHPAIKISLVALAASPVPPILPTKQSKAGGTASYAIGLLVAAGLSAMVLTPAAIELIGIISGAEYHMPISHVAPIVFKSVLVPLGLGVIVRRFFPAVADRIARPASRFASLLLALACIPVVIKTGAVLWTLVGDGVVIVLVLFNLIGLAIGHALGGPEDDNRTVLALATGTRHPGVAIAIAGLNFPEDNAALAVVLWHLVLGAIVSLPYIAWRKRVKANRQQAAT
jgi:bile acid:Na+ symporter, BASS family